MVVDAGLGFGKSTQAAVEAKKKPVKKRVNFCRRRKVCGKGEWARLDEMPPPPPPPSERREEAQV